MHKALLIVSHIGAGSSTLCRLLDANPRVQICKSPLIYDHPFVLDKLTSQPHKLNNAAAIWADEILHNFQFSHKSIYKFCKFVYLIRDAKHTLCEIIKSKDQISYLSRYYAYRLRRIYEMTRKTPGAVFLTWEDMAAGRFEKLEKYLYLKDKIRAEPALFGKPNSNNLVSSKLIDECQKCYERYYGRIKEVLGTN